MMKIIAPKVEVWLMRIGRAFLMTGMLVIVSLFILGAFLVSAALVGGSFLKHGFHIPDSASVYFNLMVQLSGRLEAGVRDSIGWYLTVFGIFAALCEIVASAQKKKYKDSLIIGFHSSMERVVKIWGYAFAIFCIISFFTLAGKNREVTALYTQLNPEQLSTDFWGYMSGLFIFDLKYSMYKFLVYNSIAFFLALTITLVEMSYGFGFWGILIILTSISERLAKRFGVEDAVAPIASILVSVVGILITITF